MSSNALLNMSNESPMLLPLQHAGTPTIPAMLLRTVATTLQVNDDINAALLQQIANGLLQTIANRETKTAIATRQYKDQVHTLEQPILHYEDTFQEPPMGYVLNNNQVPHFHIPVGNGLYCPAKWIKLNNDGTVSSYADTQGPNEQPYVIDLSTPRPTSALMPQSRLYLLGSDTCSWGLGAISRSCR
jgi:hypothetical protein